MNTKLRAGFRYGTCWGLLTLLLAIGGCSASPDSIRTGDLGAGAAPAGAGGAGGAAGVGSDVGNPMIGGTPAPIDAGTAGTGGGPTPADTTHEPISIDECGAMNPAGLAAADVDKLKAAASPGALELVYPYDGTVFPRGMLAPDLMWRGADGDAVLVHIKGRAFEYTGCLTPTAPGQLTLPQAMWDQAGQKTYGKEEIFSLDFAVLSQGNAVGPVTLHFQIAQATIKGSIYYNSYSSQLGATAMPTVPGGIGIGNGLVLRIPPGGRVEVFGQMDCNGCHSVSADGSRLLSQFVGTGSQSYELASGAAAPTPVTAGPSGAFGALYPNGSVYLSNSGVIDVARATLTAAVGASADATLYDASNGQVLANTGIPTGALMPMFSPDGTHLVFNDYAIEQAHGLAIMRYDVATHTASEYKVLAEEPAGAMRPGWPFILPDNGGVIFVRTDGPDFSGNGAGVLDLGFGALAPFSDLSIVDVASGTVTLLAKAMGYGTPADTASNTTYLPFGEEELHHNYFPTVSPVAAGGYFWVFFDSVRHYGVLGSQRQLWGAAVNISADGTYAIDPSHPAFYLPGQELGTGNHRAFAALDPCRKDGDACTSGIDCCGGFCYVESGIELIEPVGTCSPEKTMCSKRDERCSTAADCCPPEDDQRPYSCIAGFCAYISPPI